MERWTSVKEYIPQPEYYSMSHLVRNILYPQREAESGNRVIPAVTVMVKQRPGYVMVGYPQTAQKCFAGNFDGGTTAVMYDGCL